GLPQIQLSWASASDNVAVSAYLVERCVGSGCTAFTQIASATSPAFTDAGLTPATTYTYRVRATAAAGNLSSYSNTASATTEAPSDSRPPPPPSAPTGARAGAPQIDLSWAPATDNVAVTPYLVERCSGSGCTAFTQIASVTSPAFSNTGLSPATIYTY